MTNIKFNKIEKLSQTARFPRTFRARLEQIPAVISDKLTAAQIAAIIDGPMQASYSIGHTAGYKDAQ